VSWGDNSNPTDRILMHLAEIGAGRCTITDDGIVSEPDPEMRQILLGLLVLHEDLSYASHQREQAEVSLRHVAEERERLLEDRRQAIAARDQFLAVAAHELRTPLTTLSLLVDHLIATSPDPTSSSDPSVAQKQRLAPLKRQIDRLTALVVEMLDVSRITGRGLSLDVSAVDLRDVVRTVIDRFDPEIQRRRVTVTLDAPEPVHGTWDAARLDQVVTNLLSNALKYGAGQPVEVSVRANGSHAVVMLTDHGIGIPDDERKKIFGAFARATTAKHHTGLGLGLWIAEQIVEASGGRIDVQSRLNEGSTFTVELPL